MDKQSETYVPAQMENARVFVIPASARADREIHYSSFARVDSGSQPLGDITPIKMNDPNKYNSFIEVGSIRGSRGRFTSQLIQKMPMEILSLIDRLARRRMNFDVHTQLGECYDPRDIRQFAKGIVYEYATGTTHDNDALVALDDNETGEIRQTLGISALNAYKYVPLAYKDRALDTVIVEVTGVAIKRTRDCDDEDDKPLPMFAVTEAEGGSPGTGPYVLWSLDNGDTWYSHEVDTLDSTEAAIGVDLGNGYVMVISQDAGSFNYTTLKEFYYPDEVGFDPDFTESTTGLSDNPTAIASSGLDFFMCGDAGYVYKIEEPSEGAVVLDSAESSGGDQLNDIAAFDDKNIVAVGNNGTIVFSTDGEAFSASPSSPVGVGINAQGVGMRYADEWWVGFDDGSLYVTFDAGEHWTEISLPGSANITAINDIVWSSHSIGYISATYSGNGRIYRTVCGGIKWSVQPQQSKFSMPAVDKFNELAISVEDVNLVLAGGLGDNATDGALVVGDESAT